MFLGDVALIAAAIFALVALYGFFEPYASIAMLRRPLKVYALYIGALVFMLVLYIFEMYEMRERYERLHIFTSVSSVSLISFLILFSLAKLLRINQTTMVYLAGFYFLATFFLYFWRRLFIWMFLRSGYFARRVLFVGKDSLTPEIADLLKDSDYQIYGLLACGQTGPENPYSDISIHKAEGDLDAIIKREDINVLIVAIEGRLPLDIMKKVYAYKFRGIEVYASDYFYELLTRRFPIQHYLQKRESPYINLDPFVNIFFKNTKRVIDFLGALILLALFSPLFLLLCFLIKFDSGRPVFYLQERLGFQEEPFRLIKFRTMVHNAEKDIGPQWAEKEDSRVTKTGRFLRKIRLDELPQLINVLKGDISFVGPRPIRKHFADIIEQDTPFYSLRFMIKPGLTGWAQVHHDYGGSIEGHIDKFQYDLYYIKHASLFLDLFIVLKTLQTVVRRPAY
jgi:exopolysaccharide biosynthesis polyprenyl glycosylphosphotransferase